MPYEANTHAAVFRESLAVQDLGGGVWGIERFRCGACLRADPRVFPRLAFSRVVRAGNSHRTDFGLLRLLDPNVACSGPALSRARHCEWSAVSFGGSGAGFSWTEQGVRFLVDAVWDGRSQVCLDLGEPRKKGVRFAFSYTEVLRISPRADKK